MFFFDEKKKKEKYTKIYICISVLMYFFIFLLIINLVYSAGCPNDCNSHGLCGPLGECECYYGYDGFDCSLSIITK